MFPFDEQVRKHNGNLKRFKDYALNLELPIDVSEESIEEIFFAISKEYGKENLMIHRRITEDTVEGKKIKKHTISLFRRDTILAQANLIVSQSGLTAEIFKEIFSVGVGGDNRSYTPVINLQGPFLGWDVLEKLSSEITNTLPINRVTFEPPTKKTT